VRVPASERAKLLKLYNDVIRKEAKAKSLLYYQSEWERMWESIKNARTEAGKRTLPKTPPLLLLVKFATPDGQTRGNKNAPCVVDLRRGELRIPSYSVSVRLRKSLVEALVEENGLEPRPDFVLQVTRRSFLRLIASRAPPLLPPRLPLRAIAIDENAVHGFAVAVWDLPKAGKVVLSYFAMMKPRNRGAIDRCAALLQSAADGDAEALKEARELLPLELTSPEKLAELAAATKRKEKRLNEAFIQRLVALVRKLAREAKARGWIVSIVADPISHKSLKGSRLQRTLLRARARTRNLAYYEGVAFKLYRVSGKRCPLCGQEGVEIGARRYRCARCKLEWDRDKCATFHLAQRFLEENFREDDNAYVDLRGWLREHPRALL